MRILVVLLVVALPAAGGCHLLFPFSQDDPGADGDAATHDGWPPDALPSDAPRLDLGADLPADVRPWVDHFLVDAKPWPDHTSQVDAIVSKGKVTTIAGVKNNSGCSGAGQTPGFKTSATTWKFKYPNDLVAHNGKLLIVDRDCHQILQYYPIANQVQLVAGTGQAGKTGGFLAQAQFNGPTGIAVDSAGKIFVADRQNNMIRYIWAGKVYILAGSPAAGSSNGTGGAASFDKPSALALRAGKLYVVDDFNYRVRQIDPSSQAVTTLAGSGVYGNKDGPALGAQFGYLGGIAADAAGTSIYVPDSICQCIRQIYAGKVSTVTSANMFNAAAGITIDSAKQLYVADRNNFRVARVSASGVATTLAGVGTQGRVDGPRLTTASFMLPLGVALDKTTKPSFVYVADAEGPTIREVELK